MKNKQLPVYGVGPAYVIIILAITAIGIYLSVGGTIPTIRIKWLSCIFAILGIAFILLGISMWLRAVIFSKIDLYIKNNQLMTTGIYSNVRNPIYSAFMFICTGAILLYSNVLLLPLPLIYWGLMTVMMKRTEEKWLYDAFGEEYVQYCKDVNRCIPWFKGEK